MKKIQALFLTLFALTLPFICSSQEALGIDDKINQAFAPFANAVEKIIFFQVFGVPFVIILLVSGALFFTLAFAFPNLRYFTTAINVVRGKYDEIEKHDGAYAPATVDGDIKDTIRDESKDGEVSHFQALATAVSGTVGLGNIAGVAVAITIGGPGATFWMICLLYTSDAADE